LEYKHIAFFCLILGMSLWVIVLFILRHSKAKSCKFKKCGYYIKRGRSVDDHNCQINQKVFQTIKGTDKTCVFSSAYVGVEPELHFEYSKNLFQKNMIAILIGLASFLLSMIPHIFKVLE